jgi:hypothetical protein
LKKFASRSILAGALAIVCLPLTIHAQEPANAESLISNAPNVYIDCDGCDFDYIKTEITFANFVRDRKQADVHILVTDQETGSGGKLYTVEFIGSGKFIGKADTLSYTAKESDTEDMVRRGLVHIFRLGLVPYVARTPLADQVRIQYSVPRQQTAKEDRWNYWVFEIELSGWVNGEKSFRQMYLYGDVEARRVTEKWKFSIDFWGNYNENKYDYENYKVLSLSRSKGASGDIVRSLTDHWSLAFSTDVSSSTYSNRAIQVYNGPGIEYNFFPYSESTRRQLRLSYVPAVRYVRYEEKTIYDKTEEWLTSESLSLTAEMIQPWGSVSTTLSGSHYFFDFSKNYLYLGSTLSLRLVEGLSLNLTGYATRVHNQLSLSKEGASESEVLLMRRELETSYQYYLSFGLSYTFGSIYNNIVNPRFGN